MEHAVHTILKNIEEQLLAHYHDAVLANQYAWWMLEELTQRTQTELLLHDALSLTAEQHKTLQQWIKAQVEDHEPLAYLIGWVPFLDFKIICRAPTLIPRPETEEWVSDLINFLKKINKPLSILDLCTGSGCIAIALAKAFPSAHIIATDISDSALKLARENADANGVTNIQLIKSDVYAGLPNMKFDLIIANPPYITPEEWKSLDLSVSKWEDPQALAAPDHGLVILKQIIKDAPLWLKDELQSNTPRLVLEIGYLQGPSVKELMEQAGFKNVEVKKDLAGKDRVVIGF